MDKICILVEKIRCTKFVLQEFPPLKRLSDNALAIIFSFSALRMLALQPPEPPKDAI